MAVNGKPTPELSSFIQEVNKIPDNTYFRLRAMTFDNVPWVATMKKNEHYVRHVTFHQYLVAQILTLSSSQQWNLSRTHPKRADGSAYPTNTVRNTQQQRPRIQWKREVELVSKKWMGINHVKAHGIGCIKDGVHRSCNIGAFPSHPLDPCITHFSI